MPDELMNQKNTFGGVLFQKMTKCEKSIFFKKKNFVKFFLAHLKRNLFLILKWFYFLIFAQNWLICEGFFFSILKIDFFPLWWGGPPGAPWGVKIFPKMVPMIIIGHIMKVYDEKLAKKNSSVWLYKYSPRDRGAQVVWLSEIITWASEQSERGAKKHDLYFI